MMIHIHIDRKLHHIEGINGEFCVLVCVSFMLCSPQNIYISHRRRRNTQQNNNAVSESKEEGYVNNHNYRNIESQQRKESSNTY
jgi:cell division protein FtsL